MSTQDTPGHTSAQSPTSQAKQKAGELTEHAKTAVRDVAQDAASAAKDQAETAKSSVADEMSGVASALRTAAEQMRSGSPQERTFGQIAEGLADASEAMRNKDLSEMVQDVSAFARNNPLVFLGGAALIGFAATRFAKASGGREVETTRIAPGTTAHGEVS
ncbi:hypothetical protein KX928_17200 [Roseobacter sp. YSTF-M11]|uniref:Late embryogenesis abundant protein n=1 Tax=Roseobacter insulae TaxID=2859783 RepID=A0A9X1K1S2_9RHOB|nr:hypothetical protein [Roseobacter insulae]MBW4709529.1 hypothetical protein [Roseobacter insulae]